MYSQLGQLNHIKSKKTATHLGSSNLSMQKQQSPRRSIISTSFGWRKSFKVTQNSQTAKEWNQNWILKEAKDTLMAAYGCVLIDETCATGIPPRRCYQLRHAAAGVFCVSVQGQSGGWKTSMSPTMWMSALEDLNGKSYDYQWCAKVIYVIICSFQILGKDQFIRFLEVFQPPTSTYV